MTLNNLLASPGFAPWMQGEPLQIPGLLHTPEGRPRISIVSIAHLPEPERMFFVTLLLNEVLSWMRTQSGTTSLRALLCMDEILGFFPPTSAPPSKTPMLTLMKQARAYGLGVILATQNPVDLDYKGLSNAGTWFIGRLQTERDKARVMEGLESASSGVTRHFDEAKLDRTLSGLGSRVFLMHNVHEDEPVLFHTRWCLSYLRGPLTRLQIASLTKGQKQAAAEAAPPAPQRAPAAMVEAGQSAVELSPRKPVLPSGIPQFYLPAGVALAPGEELVYRGALFASVRLHFVLAKARIDEWETVSLVAPLPSGSDRISWSEAVFRDEGEAGPEKAPSKAGRYADLPAPALRVENYGRWEKSLAAYLYQNRTLTWMSCPALRSLSRPRETEAEFRARLIHAFHERRDLEMEKLRKRYAIKIDRLTGQIRKAELRIERETSQYKHQKAQTAISLGATVLGALFGRKKITRGTIGRATTTARGAGRTAREREDISRAREDMEALMETRARLEAELAGALEKLRDDHDPERLEVVSAIVRPRKSDISVRTLGLAWTPWRVGRNGIAEPRF